MDSRPIRIPRKHGPLSNTPARERRSTPVVVVAPAGIVRFEPGEAAPQLPDERVLRIDVNGCLAGAIRALPDAPRELGVGWAFMHGFFEATDALEHVTVDEGRVSIMVDGGGDLERLRLEAVGWTDAVHARSFAAFAPHEEALSMDESELADLVTRTFREFQGDGGAAGYIHAAVASGRTVHCIARDLRPDIAVAKVLGWSLLDGREQDARVLLVRGIADHAIAAAAARSGVSLVISDAIATAPAIRVAARAGMSIVTMATSRRPGLVVDGGHVRDEPVAR